jgi:UDP-glucuronate decarboxylase
VTGGAGFLGSHQCIRLLRDGHQVAIDNLVSGNLDNLATLSRESFKFTSPQHYQRDPEQTMRTCVQGATHVLHQARRSGARIFPASAREVYREPEIHPHPALDVQPGNAGRAGPSMLETVSGRS